MTSGLAMSFLDTMLTAQTIKENTDQLDFLKLRISAAQIKLTRE